MTLETYGIKKYLEENPFLDEESGAEQLMEFIAEQYLERNPVSNEKIKGIEREMAPYFEAISLKNSNRMFMLVYDLCVACQDAAFREGIKIGLHLWDEICQGNRAAT